MRCFTEKKFHTDDACRTVGSTIPILNPDPSMGYQEVNCKKKYLVTAPARRGHAVWVSAAAQPRLNPQVDWLALDDSCVTTVASMSTAARLAAFVWSCCCHRNEFEAISEGLVVFSLACPRRFENGCDGDGGRGWGWCGGGWTTPSCWGDGKHFFLANGPSWCWL